MRIREMREASGMTQREAARSIGVTPAALCNWERGIREPRARILPKIAEALGCRIPDLFGGDDEQAT